MFHLRGVYPVFHPNALTPFAVNLKHGRHVGRFSTTEKDTAGLYVKRQRSTGLTEGCAGPGINTSSFPVHTVFGGSFTQMMYLHVFLRPG